MLELFERILAEQWGNALRDVGYSTGAIAIFQAYFGLGPKDLPAKLRLLPAFLLTAVLLGLDCVPSYGWGVGLPVAIVAAALVGAPASKVLHDFAQGTGRALSSKAPPKTLRSGQSAVLIVLCCVPLLSGCAQVKAASDWLAGICTGVLASSPDVQAEAERRTEAESVAISPFDVAKLVCFLNDGGRYVYEWFEESGLQENASVSAARIQALRAYAVDLGKRRGVLR